MAPEQQPISITGSDERAVRASRVLRERDAIVVIVLPMRTQRILTCIRC